MSWLFGEENPTIPYKRTIIKNDRFNRTAFTGIFIGEAEYRGKGYGAEAIRLILQYGFGTMNLNTITLSVYKDNWSAPSCSKKADFREAGRRRGWAFKDGKYVDVIYMYLLAREFEE